MTGIDQKVFSRAFRSRWDHENHQRINGDMAKWSLWHSQHTKGQPPHRVATSKLTAKQQANLKSPIKDTKKYLNSVRNCFNPLYSLFSSGSRVVDHFSSRISFHSFSSSDEDLYHHLQNLNCTFKASQTSSNSIAVIADGGVKKSHVATAAAHIWFNNSIIQRLQIHSINIMSIEAELMAIHTGLIPTIERDNIHNIIVIVRGHSEASQNTLVVSGGGVLS